MILISSKPALKDMHSEITLTGLIRSIILIFLLVQARVAIKKVNHLPKSGLLSRIFRTDVAIFYKDSTVGPTGKQHYHLTDYVVVDILYLNLPPYIDPWDINHPTMS